MKKLLLILLCLPIFGYTQTFVSTTAENKNVVLEQFTGIYCGFCPDGHAIGNALYAANPGDVFLSRIHAGGYSNPNGPSDPDFNTIYGMAIHNVSGLAGYPAGTVNRRNFESNGISPQGSSGSTALSRGDWAAALAVVTGESSYVNVAAQANYDMSTGILTVNSESYFTSNSTASSNSLHVKITQNNTPGPQSGAQNYNPSQIIIGPWSPTYNHQYMFRHLMDGANGLALTTTSAGTFTSNTHTWNVPTNLSAGQTTTGYFPNLDPIDMSVIVFITDDVGEIVTGNEAVVIPIYPNQYDADVTASSANDVLCAIATDIGVTFRNYGSDTLTSLDLTYDINGGTPATYNWTGNMASGATETVSITNVSFTPQASNTVNWVASNPNGQVDQNLTNNTSTTSFTHWDLNGDVINGIGAGTINVSLLTDGYGSETTWDIKDESGNIVGSGGPYSNNTQINETAIVSSGCYSFTLYDSYGDGMCCTQGVGQALITDASGNIIFEGTPTNLQNFTEISAYFHTGFFGCTDPLADNYDPLAVNDDGSCYYCDLNNTLLITQPSDSISCDGFVVVNSSSSYTINPYIWTDYAGNVISTSNFAFNLCNGIYFLNTSDSIGCVLLDTVILGTISGCTDYFALNYNPFATSDDGSCIYPTIYGCTDSLAYNYNPIANTDDGSCLYCDLSNSFLISNNTSGQCNGFILANSSSSHLPISYLWSNGVTQNNISSLCAGVYSILITDNVGCIIEDTIYMNIIPGCMDPLASNYNPLATYDDGSCIYCLYGCMDPLALNFNSLATCDDGSCTYSSNCTSPKPDGLYAYDVIDTRAKVGWNNMNDVNCMVWKYFVRYREVGTPSWNTKSAGVGNGLCNFGLNTVNKQLLNLTPSTTYEFRMKAFYCGGTESNYSTPVQFTTSDACPDMTNLSVQTFTSNTSKAKFTWDTTGAYVFARITLRVDTAGANWQTAGGFGVYYPTLFVNKFGLQSGEAYRAQGRTFCDASITAYRSPTWTAPVFWTQPGTIRLDGGTSITELDIYPNPSRDVFNISFNSETLQDLSIRILNVVGAEVYKETKDEFIGEYTKQISLDDYGKGIYFLEIETSTGVVNKKLILQ